MEEKHVSTPPESRDLINDLLPARHGYAMLLSWENGLLGATGCWLTGDDLYLRHFG